MTNKAVLTAAVCVAVLAVTGRAGADEALDGLIEPSEVVEVSSQVPGILDEILVERGDMVRKGQVLARLRDGLERIAVDQARLRVEFSERRAERNAELYESELVSAHERDELETEIQLNRLQLQEATERLSMRTIRSPVRGVVTERSRAPGEYVGTDPILTVARLDPLNVEVIAPLELLGSVATGMRAEVRPREPAGGVYTGEVVIVDRVVDAASATFRVRVRLANEDHGLPAGLRCMVRFPNP